LNGAVYRQKWQGVQLAAQLECGFTNGVNGGNVTSDGVELELLAKPVDAWLFNLSFSLNKSEFDSVEPGVGFTRGERLPDSPEVNGSAGAQYNFVLGPSWTGFIRADYMYVSEVRLKFEDVILQQDAFDSANLRLAFQRDALAIELFGRNIADERGVVTTGQPSFGGYQTLTRPRELGVELRYSFE
jgi:outer membrane receptor protein involved in Fe transport